MKEERAPLTDQELEEIEATVMRKGDGETGCLRCGADEWRINGYCSCECEMLAEREDDIATLLAEVRALRAENARLREVAGELRDALATVREKAGNNTISLKPDPRHPGFTGILAVSDAALAKAKEVLDG